MGAGRAETLHASAVAAGSAGLLILGASGSGKSTLALEMIALGAALVADDRVEARPLAEGGLALSSPEPLAGLIEARGVGLLRLPNRGAFARAAVDLDRTETQRLPEAREIVIAGVTLPLLCKVDTPAFASILVAYLKGGRAAP